MHNYFQIYYFVDKFDLKDLSNIKSSINIIYRNYSTEFNVKDIIKIREFCKKKRFKFFLSNNIKLASKLDLNGVYLPAFNKKMNYSNFAAKKNFSIIGSAHSLREIRIKEFQNCEKIFISPIFKTDKNKSYLDIVKFNILASKTKRDVICLGGIKKINLKKIKMTKSRGLASISWIKKNGLNKNLGRF